MTIYTPQTNDKKQQDNGEDPEVVLEPLNEKKDVEPGVVILHGYLKPKKKVGFCVKLLLCAIFLLFVCSGAMGGYYIYRHFAHHHNNQYHKDQFVGRCGVGIDDKDLTKAESEQLYGNSEVITETPHHVERHYMPTKEPFTESSRVNLVTSTLKPKPIPKRHIITENVTVDIKHQYETLQVPKLDGTRATILHDFERGFTAIADLNALKCYILPLDKKVVAPPKDILDLIFKFARGYYIPNVRLIRQKYRAVRPALTSLKRYGLPITRLCGQRYTSYRLQKLKDSAMDMHKLVSHHIKKLLGMDGHDNWRRGSKRNHRDHRERHRRSTPALKVIEATSEKQANLYIVYDA